MYHFIRMALKTVEDIRPVYHRGDSNPHISFDIGDFLTTTILIARRI